MSIANTDLQFWCAASMPNDDASTSGGAISTTIQPRLTQFTSNAVAAAVSDGADTRTLTITGRLTSGVIDTDILTLNGTTEVVGVKTFERILRAVLSATSGTRTVTLRQGSGGSTRATLLPNEQETRVLFYDSTSSGSIVIRYEKLFIKNNHGTLTLTAAAITLTADPAARIRVGCATALDDTGSVANRVTAPGSITYVDDSVAQSVPTGQIAAGSRVGVWIEQNLPANDPANKTTFTLQLAGSST